MNTGARLEVCEQQFSFVLYQVPCTFLQRVRIARNADRCNSYELSVCLSDCPSRSNVLSRQMKIKSCGFHSGRTILLVSGEVYRDIRRGSPPATALK